MAKRALRFMLDPKASCTRLKPASPDEGQRDDPGRPMTPDSGPASLPAAGQTTSESLIQHRDIEKLHSLTSKLEKSEEEFNKARKLLEEIVAADGNTELSSFLAKGSSDWTTELARNRQLTSKAELQLRQSSSGQVLYGEGAVAGSSYEFLKGLMG